MRKTIASLLVVLSAVLATGSATADVLVSRSEGGNAPSNYPRGARLPDSSSIVLRDGETVTVLTRDGTRRFRGPGRFETNALPTLARSNFWPDTASASRPRVAVARGDPMLTPGGQESAPEADEMPDPLEPYAALWSVDFARDSTVCYLSPFLLRPEYRASADVDSGNVSLTPVTGSGNGDAVVFEYDRARFGNALAQNGMALSTWPTALALDNGSGVAVNPASDTLPESRVRFRQIETDIFEGLESGISADEMQAHILGNARMLLTELEENGCERQAEILSATLEQYGHSQPSS